MTGHFPGHSEVLPRVLVGRGKESSISMERSLKQIQDLLDYLWMYPGGREEDEIQASLDDVTMMLAHLDRS